MKILILGGDGYLGWPTAMYLAHKGHEVTVLDNLMKRRWEAIAGVTPLQHLPPYQDRVRLWNGHHADNAIDCRICDIAYNKRYFDEIFETFLPDSVVHYAEQPSAPFSHLSAAAGVETQQNNLLGTLNLLYTVMRHNPECHIVKLGTMGEYGTPNIDIEEGWLDVEHNGRRDRVLFPKRPGSIYHLSKVHDSANLEFAARVWKLRVTDLNQGIVYGTDTDETWLHPELYTSFHYDAIFGTVINRFIAQAAKDRPLTVYGSGGQIRGFLNIVDTLRCIELAVEHPADRGEFRVFNQFTEEFSIQEIALRISKLFGARIEHLPNPRVESEDHHYKAKHTALPELGLEPNFLTDEVLGEMHKFVYKHRKNIDETVFKPDVLWRT